MKREATVRDNSLFSTALAGRGGEARRLSRREFLVLLLVGGVAAGVALDLLADGRPNLFGLLPRAASAEVSDGLDDEAAPLPPAMPSITPTPALTATAGYTPSPTAAPEYTPTPATASWLSAAFVADYARLQARSEQGVYARGRPVEGRWNADGSYTGPVYYTNPLRGYDGPFIRRFTIPDPRGLMARMPGYLPQEIVDEVARNHNYGGDLDPSNRLNPDELVRVDGIAVQVGGGRSAIFSLFVPSPDGAAFTERLVALPPGYPEFFGITEDGEVVTVDRAGHPGFDSEAIFMRNPANPTSNDNVLFFPTATGEHVLPVPFPVTVLLTHEFDLHGLLVASQNADTVNNLIVYLPGSR